MPSDSSTTVTRTSSTLTASSIVGPAAVIAIAGAAAAAYYYFSASSSGKDSRKRKNSAASITVSRLYLFPVKSVGGIEVDSLSFVDGGIEYDREWGIFFSDTGNIATQRELPSMKLLKSKIDWDEKTLIIECSDALFEESGAKEGGFANYFRIPLEHFDASTAQKVIALLSSDLDPQDDYRLITASDENLRNMDGAQLQYLGDKVALWLSQLLQRKVYLARISLSSFRKPIKNALDRPLVTDEHKIRLQDFATATIVSEEGMRWLEAGLEEEEVAEKVSKKSPNAPQKQPIDLIGRLRPNIVVVGAPFPEEDRWATLQIGPRATSFPKSHHQGNPKPISATGVVFRTARWCSRCMLTNIDEAGRPNPNKGPTTFLNERRYLHFPHRPATAIAKPMFGLSLFHESNGVVKQGDVVHVTSVNNDLPEVVGSKSDERANGR